MKTKIIFSEKCLEYGEKQVESPERVCFAAEKLKREGFEFLTPQPAAEEALLSVHNAGYLEKLKKGDIADSETPFHKDIYEYARLSAGGAILAAEIGGFSLMRPPGHHIGKNGKALGVATMGFCYLNNIAVAVKRLNKKTLIIDIDGHHGNGTEEIFLGGDEAIYLSLHQWPLYPGTGLSFVNNCLNFPLPAECGEDVYLKTLIKGLQSVDVGSIEIVAVSAGFDTYFGDIASLGLLSSSFLKIGEVIGKLKKPTFFILCDGD